MFALVMTVALLTGEVSQVPPGPDETVVTDGTGFHVVLPPGAVMTRRVMVDFGTFEIVMNGHPIAGFYSGGAANVGDWVSNRRRSGRQEHRLASGAREYFWNRYCRRSQSIEVHGWVYANLGAEDDHAAQQIMDSVRTNPCYR